MGPGHGTADKDDVVFRPHVHNFKALHGYLFGTPVARHLPALEHVTGEGVVTDGTTGTMHLFTTVRVLGALEVPAAHDALVPLTEARTSYFNLVAGGEHVRGQHGAHFVSGRTVEADFANLAVKSRSGFGKVTLHRLGHMLFLGFFEGDLQSVVAVRFSGLDLGNRARTSPEQPSQPRQNRLQRRCGSCQACDPEFPFSPAMTFLAKA